MTSLTTDPGREAVRRAMDDVSFFAAEVLGEPAWPHQIEVLTAAERVLSVLSGRRAGKSRTQQLASLWRAFRQPGAQVLLISAGDDASQLLLSEIAALALASPYTRGAVLDDQKHRITFSNGSVIRSVPASTRQVRGASIDLLVLDEAAWISDELWSAARYTVLANPGSQILMASTPYGRRDHWFATNHRAGEDSLVSPRQPGFRSFHWPSTVSPLVDTELLDQWRTTMTDREWNAEILGVFQDDQGAYFTSQEIEDAIADFEMIEPGRDCWERANRAAVVGGIDYGMRADSHALVMLGVLMDANRNVEQVGPEPVYFIPWLEEHKNTPYHVFLDRVLEVCNHGAKGFTPRFLVSETNGVGQAPTEELRSRVAVSGSRTRVVPAHTTSRRKQAAFGTAKLLFQRGRLVLPRHPELLRQLSALEFETSDSGNVRIAVPEAGGAHDDVVMALSQALSTVKVSTGRRWQPSLSGWPPEMGQELRTQGGTIVPERPWCDDWERAFTSPKGVESPGEGW